MDRETAPYYVRAEEPAIPDAASSRRRRSIAGLAMGAIGLLALLALATWWNSYGWTMVLIVPLVAGMVLGYATDYNKVVVWLLAVLVLFGAVGGLYTMHLAGLLCGAIAAMILIVPMALGASLGLLIRVHEDGRLLRYDRRRTSVGLLLATARLLWAEGMAPLPRDIEAVHTSRILQADAAAAWESLAFYEEVGAAPPRLARIGIPYPVGSIGEVDEVGDTKRCLYETGYLVKRVTAYSPGELFAFDVIEQVGIEDRSIALIDGSFRFEPAGPGLTRIVLTTRYRPLLQARGAWRPFEHAVVHTLHDHVLDWMAQHAELRVDEASTVTGS